MRKYIIVLILILSSCSKSTHIDKVTIDTFEDQPLIFTPVAQIDQLTADAINLGQVSVNKINKQRLILKNNTIKPLLLNINDLVTKFEQTSRYSISKNNGKNSINCGSSLSPNQSCYIDIQLNYSATEDYTQGVEVNLLTGESNPMFGKIIFSGSRSTDTGIIAIAARNILRLSVISDSYNIQYGSKQTKRFFISNISSNNVILPTIEKPLTGNIVKDTCKEVSIINSLKTCYFDVEYSHDIQNTLKNEQIQFTSNSQLIDTSEFLIALSINSASEKIVTNSVAFTVVGKIVDLNSLTQSNRIYIVNNGSSQMDLSGIVIPAQLIQVHSSCGKDVPVGNSCYLDLKINPAYFQNTIGMDLSINVGSNSVNLHVGKPIEPGQSVQCKPLYTFITDKCSIAEKNLACPITNGIGNMKSVDGGFVFGSCEVVSCDNFYEKTNDNLACQPIQCTPLNAGLAHSLTVTGTKITGCNVDTCVNGYNLVNNSCIAPPPLLTNTQTNLVSNGGQMTILGTCEGTLPIAFEEIGNSNLSVNCNNGTYLKSYTPKIGADGVRSFTISETSLLGAVSTINKTYTYDTTLPSISLNMIPSIDSSNISNYPISGACSENGQDVKLEITDTIHTVTETVLCQMSLWSYNYMDISNLNDGEVTVLITHKDLAGNSSSATQTIVKNSVFIGAYNLIAGVPLEFLSPIGIVNDKNGNIYISDGAYQRIKKIDTTGKITVYAGTGVPGSLNGGKNIAQFSAMEGMAIDSSGTFYIADTTYTKIRKITPDGTVSNLAILPAKPSSVAVDSLGNVYVSDVNHSIRKITPDGTISIFAGIGSSVSSFGSANGNGTSASFSSPKGLVFDSLNNLYVADTNNHKIRKITPNGDVTTFAGTGVASSIDNAVATSATFNTPYGITLDKDNNFYITENSGHKVRKISAGGVVLTIAGGAVSGKADGVGSLATFNYPRGISSDNSGNLYVADTNNSLIRKITPDGTVTTVNNPNGIGFRDGIGSLASFKTPMSVTRDSSGNFYVVDQYNHKIRKIAPDGTTTTLAGAGTQGATDAVGILAKFNYPSGIVINSAGELFVADTNNNKIRKILADGTVTTFAGTGVAGSVNSTGVLASFNRPAGMTIDSSDNIYLTELSSHKIRKIAPDGVVTTIAGSGAQGALNNVIGTSASFYGPQGITIDSTGILYVADSGNSLIRKITPAGEVSTIAGFGTGFSDGVNGQFRNPIGIAIDQNGDLIVADNVNGKIRRVTLAGFVTTIAGNSYEMPHPTGIIIYNNKMYVTLENALVELK